MGAPMARNLLKAGTPLLAWNRSPQKCQAAAQAGAAVAANPAEVFARCEVVILMLADGIATDTVLGRDSPAFTANVGEHQIIQMGTTTPRYSRALETDIRAARKAMSKLPSPARACLQKPGNSSQCWPAPRQP